jgi:hypothetical protein
VSVAATRAALTTIDRCETGAHAREPAELWYVRGPAALVQGAASLLASVHFYPENRRTQVRTHGFSTEKDELSTGYPKHVQTCSWQGAASTEQVRRTSRFVCQAARATCHAGVGRMCGSARGCQPIRKSRRVQLFGARPQSTVSGRDLRGRCCLQSVHAKPGGPRCGAEPPLSATCQARF